MIEHLPRFKEHLLSAGYSPGTVEGYVSRACAFHLWLKGRKVTPDLLHEYRKHVERTCRTEQTARGYLAAANRLLAFLDGRRKGDRWTAPEDHLYYVLDRRVKDALHIGKGAARREEVQP